MNTTLSETQTAARTTSTRRAWVYDALLVLVLLAGLSLRLTGVNWDEGLYLHPDERFLMFVESSIRPVENLRQYFDTAISTLNPHNTGHPFFVYGTWPIFIVRYLLEWLNTVGSEVYRIGRPLSALANIGTVYLLYLVAKRLFDQRVALLAATFASFSVLDIQLSHFFKEDTFMSFFTMLTLYFAVLVATASGEREAQGDEEAQVEDKPDWQAPAGVRDLPAQPRPEFRPQAWVFVLFGLSLGMAMASKLNAAPVALTLPLAVFIRLSDLPAQRQRRAFFEGMAYLALAAFVSLVTFRILQPYAFSGPGFLGLRPNPRWLDNLRELRALTSPDSVFGFPPSLQWADRPIWFAWENMVRWGLGLPLGLLAWAGFLWAGWRIARGRWQRHLLVWSWTAVYFIWQSSVFNPTMRYQLPVYPTLILFAAWALVELWDFDVGRLTFPHSHVPTFPRSTFWRGFVFLLGALVLGATVVWALAFTRIYTQPVTRVQASRWIFANIPGPINLHIQQEDGEVFNQPLPFPYNATVAPDQPYVATFTARATGILEQVSLFRVQDLEATPGEDRIRLSLAFSATPDQLLATATLTVDLPAHQDRGQSLTFTLDPPVRLSEGETYRLDLALESANRAVYTLQGAALANETTWDDGLPLRIDGYDPYSGIYQPDLTFELYWEDNDEKRARFIDILDRADYILITSSRQWGSIGRQPERFPMTTAYYRALLGCPQERTIEWCYNVAEPGRFQGTLGFELLRTFEAHPTLGPIRINDQPSEEAFTVYDHPKVFIFKKSEAFNLGQVRAFFESIDLRGGGVAGEVREEAAHDLMLPPDRLVAQRQGGTWVELFNPQSLLNRYQGLTVLVWYLALGLLGLLTYPLLRLALPGLEDGGYPLARTAGLLILSYLVWLAGSYEIPTTRTTISLAFGLLALVGIGLGVWQRDELRRAWSQQRRYYLFVEGLFLAAFLAGLFLRLGNPDLWHPWKGGEKPMDFSYFNAVLKSTTFPPYDPWYAGGYINYYYYGFVLVGVLVKWLGIAPSVAYNLILPSLFAMIALGAFSIGWNLSRRGGVQPGEVREGRLRSLVVGLFAAGGMAVLGNLGIVRMIIRGYQRLAASGMSIDEAGMFTRWVWTVRGFFRSLGGANLPYALADWYWNPSRAIPAPNDIEPITEFPFFTVLYGDLHAHLIALPLTLLVLAWALSVVLGRGRWRGLASAGISFFLAGLAVGALRPTNTWDFYPYLALAAFAVGYALWRFARPRLPRFEHLPGLVQGAKAVLGVGAAAVLVGLAHLLYAPYAAWYAQGYNAVDLWRGTHTPTSAYLYHWGMFLLFIVSWMAWETRDWLANTPLSALRKLQPYRGLIQAALVLLLAWIGVLLWLKVAIAWLVLPLTVWAGVLIFRPGMPEAKRAVLFLVGTGLTLTLMVEVIVLRGDIGRMNTVFKFYLQVWTLLAISAAGALGWLLPSLKDWTPTWRRSWSLVAVLLVASTALYPMMGGLAKIRDRMAPDAPHTLDGMAYMAYATYNDLNTEMDLSQDYRAIHWMQEHVEGSPVIVEGNMVEYHWGSRFTIYTGLPGVLGWNWHQRQQRAVLPPEVVTDRVAEIDNFYNTTDVQEALAFLARYDVRYIIVGQLERAKYAPEGLDKFPQYDGVYWQAVYGDRDTVIYEVLQARGEGGGAR